MTLRRAPPPACREHRAGAPGADGVQAALLAALVGGVAWFSVTQRRPLGTLGGFTAPDAALGFNLAAYGVVGVGTEPTVFKAPGHVVFMAAVTRLAIGRPSVGPACCTPALRAFDPDELRRAAGALYAAQALLLAAASGVLFVWLSGLTTRGIALALSLAFGLNPLAIALVGLLHYALLHLALLVVCTWLLQRALATPAGASDGRMLLAGLAWGLTTSVRSVTLPLPAFVLLALLSQAACAGPASAPVRRSPRQALRLALVFALAFGLGLAPASWRASRLAGRFVAVNAQLWSILWNVTRRDAPAMPNHFRWKLFRDDFLVLQSATAGRALTAAGDPYAVSENLAMEDIAREQTRAHLRRDPWIYVRNVARSFVSFNWGTSAVLVQLHQYAQRGRRGFPNWFWPSAHEFHDRGGRDAFTWLQRLLTLLAFGGLLIAARQRDPTPWAALAVYACLCAAHSLVWLDVLYYYAKLPFLYVGAAYALDRLGRISPPGGARLARALTWTVALAHGVLCVALLHRGS